MKSIESHIQDWLHHLEVRNLSPRSIQTYQYRFHRFRAFFTDSGMEDVTLVDKRKFSSRCIICRWEFSVDANLRDFCAGLDSFGFLGRIHDFDSTNLIIPVAAGGTSRSSAALTGFALTGLLIQTVSGKSG